MQPLPLPTPFFMLLTYLFVFENSLDSSDLLLLAAVAEDAQTPEIGVLKNISKDDIYIDKRFQTSLTLTSSQFQRLNSKKIIMKLVT